MLSGVSMHTNTMNEERLSYLIHSFVRTAMILDKRSVEIRLCCTTDSDTRINKAAHIILAILDKYKFKYHTSNGVNSITCIVVLVWLYRS